MSAGRVPWQYSEALGGEYVYVPSQDEILLRSGRRFRRPQHLARSDLSAATYDGSTINFDVASLGEGSYSTSSAPGLHQDPRSVPRSGYTSYQASPPPNIPPGMATDLASRFNNLSVSGSAARVTPASGSSQTPRVAFVRDARGGFIANVVTSVRNVPGSRTTEVTGSEVVGSGGDTETLFPQYKQRAKRFFFVGKVFSMLWSEPAGIPNATQVTSMEEGITIGPYGERVYSKIRRFVVIRSGDTYCNALPISTYNGRGVGKRGVNKSEHCVIYTGNPPRIMDIEQARRGELPMRSTAIRVDPDNREDILDPKSRLNFGHLHTIQHNVKAKSCGKVPAEHVAAMVMQFAEVFGMHVPSGSSISAYRRTQRTSHDNDDDDDEEEEEDDDDDDDEEPVRQARGARHVEAADEEDDDDDDDGGHNDNDDDDDDDDEDNNEDQHVQRLRSAMTSMLNRGATPQDVLRTTLTSLVQRGLPDSEARTLIRKAYNQRSR